MCFFFQAQKSRLHFSNVPPRNIQYFQNSFLLQKKNTHKRYNNIYIFAYSHTQKHTNKSGLNYTAIPLLPPHSKYFFCGWGKVCVLDPSIIHFYECLLPNILLLSIDRMTHSFCHYLSILVVRSVFVGQVGMTQH